MIREIKDGTAFCVCRNLLPDGKECGQEFSVPFPALESSGLNDVLRSHTDRLICDGCRARNEQAQNERRKAERDRELAETLDERLLKTGIPARFRTLEKPWMRPAAEWIFRHRHESLLIAGETGVGKTSSACFVMRWMMRRSFLRVRYYTRQTLIAEFVQAKTSDSDNESRFLSRLDSLDYLIIDELVGKKGEARLSPAGQELLFNIVDGVYSWARGTRVWIMGNFRPGSIDRLVDDPRPYRRRFQDSFRLAWFEKDKVDESLTIFNEEEIGQETE